MLPPQQVILWICVHLIASISLNGKIQKQNKTTTTTTTTTKPRYVCLIHLLNKNAKWQKCTNMTQNTNDKNKYCSNVTYNVLKGINI